MDSLATKNNTIIIDMYIMHATLFIYQKKRMIIM